MQACHFRSMLSPEYVKSGKPVIITWTSQDDTIIGMVLGKYVLGINHSQIMSRFLCSSLSIKTWRASVLV